jgi:hypothetical protein
LVRRRERNGEAKKKHELSAELAFWYGVDPYRLTAEQQIGLRANLPRMKAQDRIHRGDFDATDYRGVYELFLAAYDDEEVAQRAQSQAAENYVNAACNAARRG